MGNRWNRRESAGCLAAIQSQCEPNRSRHVGHRWLVRGGCTKIRAKHDARRYCLLATIDSVSADGEEAIGIACYSVTEPKPLLQYSSMPADIATTPCNGEILRIVEGTERLTAERSQPRRTVAPVNTVLLLVRGQLREVPVFELTREQVVDGPAGAIEVFNIRDYRVRHRPYRRSSRSFPRQTPACSACFA